MADLRDPKDFTPAEGISVFAPLYIVAQAIERFIEPFATYLGVAKPDKQPEGTDMPGGVSTTTTDRKTKPAAQKLLNQAVSMNDTRAAAVWSRVVDRIRRNTAVISWALASSIAMILCGLFDCSCSDS